MQRFLVLLFLVFSWSNFAFSTQYNLLPENLIPMSDCAPEVKTSCPGYSFNPINDCKNGTLDSTSCEEINLYNLSAVVLVNLGDSSTEGGYIKCNGGTGDFDSCSKYGAFSRVDSYSQSTPNINKIAHFKLGAKITNSSGTPYYCPTIGCDVRTDSLRFNVNNFDNTVTYYYSSGVSIGGATGKTDVVSPQMKNIGSKGVSYRVEQMGNNACLLATTDVGQMLIGCKGHPNISSPPPVSTEGCFKNIACASKNKGHSKTFWSVSSKIVECVRDVLSLVFINDDNCQNKNFFPGLQDNLRQTVMAALILYVVFFGIKLVTGTDFFDPKVFIGFFLKIALVLYFSVGLKGGDGRLHNGLSDLVYPGGIAAMTSLSTFVMESTSDNGLCNYRASDYEEGYGYLSIWDSLDCRVAYYLGLYLIKGDLSGYTSPSSIFGIFGLFVPALLSLEFIFLFLLIIYGIFILSVVVYFVHFYVIALIAFTITVYLGVITVPMALFGATKQYFDAWVRILLSYVMQPVVVTAFLAFLLLVFDSVIYGDCQFEHGHPFGSYDSWIISDSNGCTDPKDPRCSTCVEGQGVECASVTKCKDSIGWLMLGGLNDEFLDEKNATFFKFKILGKSVTGLMESLLKVVLFVYLLSLFAADLGNFASRITSGPNIGKFAGDPAAVFKKIMDAITKGKGGKKGKGKGKGKSKGVKVGGKKRSGINVKKAGK